MERDLSFPQFIKCDDLVLAGIEQALHPGGNAGQLTLQRVGSPSGTGRVVRGFQTPVDFPLDEVRVLEQGRHLRPDGVVELVGAQCRIVAHGSPRIAPIVGSVTPIAVQARVFAASRPGVPSQGAAAMHADAQSLQQRRLDGLAPRETPAGRTLLPRALEKGGVHDGGNGQFDPVLSRACHAPGQAPDGTALLSARTHRLQIGRLADAGFVPQDDSHGRDRPVPRMSRMRALLVEPAGDPEHLQPVADMEIEDPAHHAGFGLVDLEAGSACLGLPDQAVSAGRARACSASPGGHDGSCRGASARRSACARIRRSPTGSGAAASRGAWCRPAPGRTGSSRRSGRTPPATGSDGQSCGSAGRSTRPARSRSRHAQHRRVALRAPGAQGSRR